MKKSVVLLALLLAGTGAHAALTSNGIQLNGVKLNGVKLNGIKLNGVSEHALTSQAGANHALVVLAAHPLAK